jgi:hypothetical protein
MYSSFVHYIYIYIITGKSGGVVRIINRRTAERALLKDFIGRVIDIAFAHIGHKTSQFNCTYCTQDKLIQLHI